MAVIRAEYLVHDDDLYLEYNMYVRPWTPTTALRNHGVIANNKNNNNSIMIRLFAIAGLALCPSYDLTTKG